MHMHHDPAKLTEIDATTESLILPTYVFSEIILERQAAFVAYGAIAVYAKVAGLQVQKTELNNR